MKYIKLSVIRITTEEFTFTSHASYTVPKNTVYGVGSDGEWYIYDGPTPELSFYEGMSPERRNKDGYIQLWRDYWKHLLDPKKPAYKKSPHDSAFLNAPYKVIS